jgi:hypothetical protein
MELTMLSAHNPGIDVTVSGRCRWSGAAFVWMFCEIGRVKARQR